MTLAFRKPFPFVENDLTKKLAENGFKVPEDGEKVIRITPDGRQSFALRWTKDAAEVYYDAGRSFFSSEGGDIASVSRGFSEICQIARDILGIEFESQLRWAEVNAAVRAIGAKRPLEVLSQKGSGDLGTQIGRVIGFELRPMTVGFFSSAKEHWDSPLTEIPDWVYIGVEPFIPNPTYYLFRVVCRLTDITKVDSFGHALDKKLEKLLVLLEG